MTSREATEAHGSTGAVRLAVVEMDWGWRLFLNGEGIGRFGDRARAVQCALDVARTSGGEGRNVELLTHDRFGEIYVADMRAPPGAELGIRAAA
jgi:hypothetical protein